MDIQLNIKRFPPPCNIKVNYPRTMNRIVILWDTVYNPDQNTNNIIMYNVYRGLSANGIFYKINTKPLVINNYEDRKIGKNPNTVYWYKVSTVLVLNYQDEDLISYIEGPLSSPVIYRVTNTNKWFNKANERSLWILKNTGQLFDLYTRKTEGKICSKCYDSMRGRAGDNNCTVCFGTGFEGGYEPMFQLYVRLKPAETSLSVTPMELTYNNIPGAWTIAETEIKNRDLLISPQGIVYSVLSTHINQVAGFLLHQELKLKELDRTDPLYNLQRTTLYPNL